VKRTFSRDFTSSPNDSLQNLAGAVLMLPVIRVQCPVEQMKFSIITPSFRSARWLKLCIASVADQDVEHEHIVQDSCSDDGTQEWLSKDSRVKAFIEKDQGMYDAVNRGLRRASGEILAYLNCDEQYLPGALAKVEDYFQKNPRAEVVFGNMIVVNSDGDYLCGRQVTLPRKHHTWVGNTLSTYTCATFFRRSIIANRNLFFDAQYKGVGDAEWVLRLIKANVTMGLLPEFTSVFTMTGANLSGTAGFDREKQQLVQSAPAWARRAAPIFTLQYRLGKFLAGHYWPNQPQNYALYTVASPETRTVRQVHKNTYKWPQYGE
jgi:glycosyltransferase involved in cell wall biosynthesis